MQSGLEQKIGKIVFLDTGSHVNVLYTEQFKPLTDSLGATAGDDTDDQAFLDGVVDGVTILDVDGTHGFSIGKQGDDVGRQDTVDVENDGFKVVRSMGIVLIGMVVYCSLSNWNRAPRFRMLIRA
jgi:hypothetical protein